METGFVAQVLAQSKQFISTYLERSSAVLQPVEQPERSNGASTAAVAVQTQSPQSTEMPTDSDAAEGSGPR